MARQYFYPRSPCGERQICALCLPAGGEISIHALLAESDLCTFWVISAACLFLSTLSLRRATWLEGWNNHALRISIHALLAESDLQSSALKPRMLISIHALLAESDGCAICAIIQRKRFLSTLSLRRATISHTFSCIASLISIHALLAESDCQIKFFPVNPC